MNAWHKLSITEAASLLDTDVEQGLSGNEAKQRLARYGPNKLRKGKRFSALVIFASQFRSLVIWVLIGAAAVSAALGETVDGIAIIALLATMPCVCLPSPSAPWIISVSKQAWP